MYKMILTEDDRRNRDRRMPRIALKIYKNSPFEYLYNSLSDQALLNATGHNHRTFNLLLKEFEPYYNYYKYLTRNLMLEDKYKICGLYNSRGQ